MLCLKCGSLLEEGSPYCKYCGNEVKESLDITFEDPEEVVEDPVILESHTFSEDLELPKMIHEELGKEENEVVKKKPFNPLVLILFVFVLCGTGYFIYPLFIVKDNKILKREVLSDSLDNHQVSLNGEVYSLNKAYSYYEKSGWSIDSSFTMKDYESVLSKNEKTPISYQFFYSGIKGVSLDVGFYNSKDESTIITECNIYGIRVMILNDETDFDFILPGNIKKHSSISDVVSQYGEVSEDDISNYEEEQYVVYHYEKEGSYKLDLTFYQEGGLLGFQYEVV